MYFWVATLRLEARSSSLSLWVRLAGGQRIVCACGRVWPCGGYVLLHGQVHQGGNLVAVCPEDVVFAAGEVRMHLTGQQRVLGDVGGARVLSQGEHQQPCDANDDEQGGEVRGNPEDARVLAERQQRC